jgi:chromosome segregation ATPase
VAGPAEFGQNAPAPPGDGGADRKAAVSNHEKSARSAGTREDRDRAGGELADAALSLERELARFEELAAAARRVALDTRRGIERAAKTATEAAETQQRVNAALAALVAALGVARERYEANAAALAARGEEIRGRAARLEELFLSYAALGDEGKVINQLAQETAARQREATSPEQVQEVIAALSDLDGRMARLIDGARELVQAATAASIVDLAEQADGMRQQVAAVRNKVGLLRKGLAARLPGAPLPN